MPEAEIHLLDAGHFALDTHHGEIAQLVRDFLARKLDTSRTRGDMIQASRV